MPKSIGVQTLSMILSRHCNFIQSPPSKDSKLLTDFDFTLSNGVSSFTLLRNYNLDMNVFTSIAVLG